jgi:hypothetical protein
MVSFVLCIDCGWVGNAFGQLVTGFSEKMASWGLKSRRENRAPKAKELAHPPRDCKQHLVGFPPPLRLPSMILAVAFLFPVTIQWSIVPKTGAGRKKPRIAFGPVPPQNEKREKPTRPTDDHYHHSDP